MQIEKRMILFLIGLALVVSVVVYMTTKKAYQEAPKDGSVISTEQSPTHNDANPTPPADAAND